MQHIVCIFVISNPKSFIELKTMVWYIPHGHCIYNVTVMIALQGLDRYWKEVCSEIKNCMLKSGFKEMF